MLQIIQKSRYLHTLISRFKFAHVFFLMLLMSGAAQALTDSYQSDTSLTPHSAPQIQKATLIVGSEQDYPPFATGMTDETAGGFTVDLWRAVAAEAGLNYQLRVLPFHQLLDEFRQGKIDVLINLAQSDERHHLADFTVPHVVIHGAIFVRKSATNIHTEADLTGKSIIVLNADLAHDYAVSRGWEKQLVLVNTAAEGMRLLASGKHDAMLLGKLPGLQTLQALELKNIQALPIQAGFAQKFSFAVAEGQSELLAKINDGLAVSKSNGKYNALYEKYFGMYEEKQVVLRDVLTYLIPLILIFLGLAGYFLYQRHLERTESEKKYRDLYNHAPDMLMSVEALHATIIDCNQTLLTNTGYSRQEIIGMSVFKLYHPDSAEPARAAFQKFRTAKEIHTVELQLFCRDGHKIDVSLSSTAVCDKQGKLLHSRSSLRDITERKLAEEKLHTLFTAIEHSPISVVITDTNAQIEYVNPRFSAVTGYTSQEVIGRNPRILQSGLTPHATYLALWAALTNGQVWLGELINKRKNGEIYWEEARIAPVKNKAGILTHYVAAKIDISARKQAELTLQQSEERFSFMLENSPIAVRITNMRTSQVMFANQRYSELIGVVRDDVIGINPKQYYANPQDYVEIIEQLEKGNRVTNHLIKLHIPNSHPSTKWTLASYLHLEFQNESAVLGWFYDITDRKLMEEQIKHLAHFDPLTDLPNRTLFTDRLQQALAIARRDESQLALMFIDLDKFKPINDRHGHHIGDLVLKEVAQRIQACLRESDTVARIGGDEFVVLLHTIEATQDALIVAEKIRHSLNQPIKQADQTLNISSSTGIALYPEHGVNETQLIRNADTAMYYAKAAGRDTVKIYQADMQEMT